jgi:hypothetical protein
MDRPKEEAEQIINPMIEFVQRSDKLPEAFFQNSSRFGLLNFGSRSVSNQFLSGTLKILFSLGVLHG